MLSWEVSLCSALWRWEDCGAVCGADMRQWAIAQSLPVVLRVVIGLQWPCLDLRRRVQWESGATPVVYWCCFAVLLRGSAGDGMNGVQCCSGGAVDAVSLVTGCEVRSGRCAAVRNDRGAAILGLWICESYVGFFFGRRGVFGCRTRGSSYSSTRIGWFQYRYSLIPISVLELKAVPYQV
jgi:hypothetical protein